MSKLRGFSFDLSPAIGTFLACVAIGLMTAIAVGTIGRGRGASFTSAVFVFAVWLILGLLFGCLAWVIDTLSLWRGSLATRSVIDRDPAVQALRERYARGEIDENQFEAMLRHLKEA